VRRHGDLPNAVTEHVSTNTDTDKVLYTAVMKTAEQCAYRLMTSALCLPASLLQFFSSISTVGLPVAFYEQSLPISNH
jgi:hypothetical protein